MSNRFRHSVSVAAAAMVWIAFAVTGCDRTPTVPSPNPPTTPPSEPAPPPAPPGTVVVTGIVSGDGVPLGNARVHGWKTTPRWGLNTFSGTTTDASGGYRAEVEVPSEFPLTVWVTAEKDGYPYQPCAAWFQLARANEAAARTVDVDLRSAGNLSMAQAPRAPDRRTISGTVYTMTSTGKQPVRDAFVSFDEWNDAFVASTVTDSAGHFMLCQLPVNRTLLIHAGVPYQGQGWVRVDPGGDAKIELILAPFDPLAQIRNK